MTNKVHVRPVAEFDLDGEKKGPRDGLVIVSATRARDLRETFKVDATYDETSGVEMQLIDGEWVTQPARAVEEPEPAEPPAVIVPAPSFVPEPADDDGA